MQYDIQYQAKVQSDVFELPMKKEFIHSKSFSSFITSLGGFWAGIGGVIGLIIRAVLSNNFWQKFAKDQCKVGSNDHAQIQKKLKHLKGVFSFEHINDLDKKVMKQGSQISNLEELNLKLKY